MTDNYIKGPWNLMFPDNPYDGWVQDSDGKLVSITSGDECRKKAQLITAAPDMLAALENLLPIAARAFGALTSDLDQARAAIAKAKGESI